MIVGTAGHIDHGKTTLVRALTGVDTDRLKEEKTRGISIELGYAYAPLPNGEVLGFIDVPGHERLVHTMTAGACGIDFVLLVIAADDGIMPQTREHLAIVELLGISEGAVALTKVDRVDAERLHAVRSEVSGWLEGSAFAGCPIVDTRSLCEDDAGVAALKRYLAERAAVRPARRTDGFFRLAVDRVFTLAGVGTVVTGTVFAGTVSAGDSLCVAPRGVAVRVRGIHAQNQPAERGFAGQRCALNLAGIARDEVARGDWIVDERLAAGSERLDVELVWLRDAGIALKHGMPLHVHLATTHRMAHVVMLEERERGARVQLVFDAPVCALAGDRFILRNAQATHTVGGGRVLDPFGPARKRATSQRRALLDALAQWLDSGRIDEVLKHVPSGMTRPALERLIGCDANAIALPGEAVAVSTKHRGGADEYFVHRNEWRAMGERALSALREFHARAPDEQGPEMGRLRRIAAPLVDEGLWNARIEALLVDGTLVRVGPWLHLPEHRAHLSEQEDGLAQRMLRLLDEQPYEPQWVRDLASELGEPEDVVRRLVRVLARRAEAYQVVPDLVYSRNAVRAVAQLIVALIEQGECGLAAATFRDASGLGRKRAIQVLEFYDRIGLTRFQRGVRLLRPDNRLLDSL
ncbi:selenocysteine-specific translation elongation factor [Trinickia caryophylli]|uniref:Selenocysteine-specific elongation factor n=1 Tax=Trinickia caryophylli TaxID=28094 RepID=A0A1X7G2G3_TRICW|nr:selenocysteine-specific translation elongation factor [Trinickia caryophylli]PMS13916.1 selenocysteine-specific translation elongation factor [Trinickia caryophylli]TRX14186.1 selenocysteine-specific translation elongation factor [Trinickia caryophylli]WQE14010.1 selenocysteine-specific translation elongation factor [Trinickia caryophylli]SMF62664.1 selenocysteine-specific translation elongation factor SelB [Trinickia caryophylli]GLU33506.1 selenocysteine-specific translation factor [Trinic